MPRANLWFPTKVLQELDDVAEAIGAGRGEAVRVLLEMAAGNFRRLRHDLRQPLQTIIASAELIAGETRRPDIREEAQRILRQGWHVTARLAAQEAQPTRARPA